MGPLPYAKSDTSDLPPPAMLAGLSCALRLVESQELHPPVRAAATVIGIFGTVVRARTGPVQSIAIRRIAVFSPRAESELSCFCCDPAANLPGSPAKGPPYAHPDAELLHLATPTCSPTPTEHQPHPEFRPATGPPLQTQPDCDRRATPPTPTATALPLLHQLRP